MTTISPFLRYINNTSFMPNSDFTIAYDCRMLYILDGSGILHTEFGDFILKTDTFAYYPSGIKYFPESNKNAKLKFITVNFDFTSEHENVSETLLPVLCNDFVPILELASYHNINEPLFQKPFIIENAVFLKHDLIRLNEIFNQDGEYAKEISSALLKLCIYDILKYDKNITCTNHLVEETKKYIEQNYSDITNNLQIAQHFGYHEYYLNSLFKKHTGKTIHKYITEVRIKNAQEMLAYSNKSISDIATLCGFINSDHFSRIFKEKMGINALKYRNKSRII